MQSMDYISDTELVTHVLGGDKEAFGQLVERHQQMVERIASKMINDERIAHELVQEAILQAYLSLDHLRNASRFKSWLYGITLNICRGYLHDQKMEILSLETIMGGRQSDIITNFDDMVDPQILVEAQELHRLVLDAIDELSVKDKEATLLFYYEQLTLQEIAALSGVSVGAIKGRLHRARKQLQQQLSSENVPGRRKRQRKQRKNHMRKVTIDAVREHPAMKQYFVVLKDEHDSRLVFWIGKAEALAIVSGLNEISPPRPMATQLMASLLEVTGIQIKEVRIEACKDDIYYAVITISQGDKEYDLDARPSDALGLAVLRDCPIYVADAIMERAEQATPFEQMGLLSEFRDVNREGVLSEYKDQKENFLQFFASLTRSSSEFELQGDKEEREKTKQELIDSWKAERRKNQQET